jgi:hypothetical protein
MKRDLDRRRLLTGLGIAGAGALAQMSRARGAAAATLQPRYAKRLRLRDVYDKVARTDDGVAEARIPVQSLLGSATAQYSITASGVYYLTQNITGVGGLACIEILADNVEIECDGFVFNGVPGTRACITAPAPRRCIGIYDAGFVVWKGTCIELGNCADSLVEDCWFDSCDASSAAGTTGGGTAALGDGGVFFDCDVRSCKDSLVSVGHHGIIEECTNINGTGGCFSSNGDAVMEDNFAMSNDGNAITIAERGVVIGNRVLLSGGIHVGASSVVSENDVDGAPGNGISVHGPQCCVEENFVANCNAGIVVHNGGDQTLVECNQIVNATVGAVIVEAQRCFVVCNYASGSDPTVEAYVIPSGNAYGPLLTVSGVDDISAVPGSDHPWANFRY